MASPAPAVEVVGRLVDDEQNRMPSAGAYKLYYTATDQIVFGMTVCNGEGVDAHISMWKVEAACDWVDGAGAPPPYTVVVKKVRVESDAEDGNIWSSPVSILNTGDRLVVRTDVYGVTFDGHGWKFLS